MKSDETAKKETMKKDIFYTLITILSAITIFSLGYFTANLLKMQKPALVIEKLPDQAYYKEREEKYQGLPVVASINGARYHYEHCPGARSIKEENKINFPNAEEAELAGYTLAANCR